MENTENKYPLILTSAMGSEIAINDLGNGSFWVVVSDPIDFERFSERTFGCEAGALEFAQALIDW